MANQLDLPAGTTPARAKALQALAKKGRVTSEKLTVHDTGQTRVKLHKDVSDAVMVPAAGGGEVLVWPEDEQRYRLHAEAEEVWADFVQEQTGREVTDLKVAAAHSDDPELYSAEDAALFTRLHADFLTLYPKYDPAVGEEEA